MDVGGIEWVLLTTGGRPDALSNALASVRPDPTCIVWNGTPPIADPLPGVTSIRSEVNVGIPSGRNLGARTVTAAVVGFLDDDAVAAPGVSQQILEAFGSDACLGAVALRLVDERGETARRHVPRLGGRGAERGGEVALFLGGACAIRRAAYEDAGGYWGDLFYGHEEVELAWRLVDRGWRIRYLPEATVFHPRTEIGRHADGWSRTGRNRVMIARRTLPWLVAVVHVLAWLGLGLARAPGGANRSAYFRGWMSGWRQPVDRNPIRWRTVWRLAHLGRPPVL